MANATIVTTRDGDTVQRFQGLDGPLYRACNGNRCSTCPDLVTALECHRERVGQGDSLCGALDRLGAMRPLGLFSVDRGILTSMLSVSVTYLIILIQFRMSLA